MHISKLLKIMSNKDFTLLKKQIKQEAERRKEALQLLQTDVIKSFCKNCNNELCDSQIIHNTCFDCGKKITY